MSDQYYRDALRLAQKEYRACVSGGLDPRLPVLEELVTPEQLLQGVDLGIVQIPTEWIVGMKSGSRVNAFAPNFMPILAGNSEFAQKWQRLCSAHLTEGIRDPIKAYEYLNRYYVEEGNKRVSVLKFFDAPSIAAHVIRVLPERSAETENYYEYVAFYALSKINFVEFSRRGGYAALQQAMGKLPDEAWTEEERRRFSAAWHYFRKAYASCGGEKLRTTVGDALLSYLQVFGYASLCSAGGGEIRKNLASMWEELTLQQEQPAIEIKTAPAEEKKPGILAKVLPGGSARPLKAAFLYDGEPERSGCVLGHELGRAHVQRVLDEKIQTRAYPNCMRGDPLTVIEQAVADGNRLIFTTSPRLQTASLQAAIAHPELVIMNCSLNQTHRYIRSYYARMYEAKFIIGAIAGSLTESGRLGYLCDYPIFGQIAGINAFALGAQMTNPRAEGFLEWSSVKGQRAAERELLEKGIHLISCQDTASLASGKRSSFGLTCVHDQDRELLAAPIWNWGVYYEKILRQFLNKTVQDEYESSSKALNYYWGMSAGVVDIRYAASLSRGTRRLADFLKESIVREVCSPFVTPIFTQSGERIGQEQDALGQEQIAGMDFLVENVRGSIPRYSQLSPIAQATVDAAGVAPATENAAERTGETEP